MVSSMGSMIKAAVNICVRVCVRTEVCFPGKSARERKGWMVGEPRVPLLMHQLSSLAVPFLFPAGNASVGRVLRILPGLGVVTVFHLSSSER